MGSPRLTHKRRVGNARSSSTDEASKPGAHKVKETDDQPGASGRQKGKPLAREQERTIKPWRSSDQPSQEPLFVAALRVSHGESKPMIDMAHVQEGRRSHAGALVALPRLKRGLTAPLEQNALHSTYAPAGTKLKPMAATLRVSQGARAGRVSTTTNRRSAAPPTPTD